MSERLQLQRGHAWELGQHSPESRTTSIGVRFCCTLHECTRRASVPHSRLKWLRKARNLRSPAAAPAAVSAVCGAIAPPHLTEMHRRFSQMENALRRGDFELQVRRGVSGSGYLVTVVHVHSKPESECHAMSSREVV